MARTLGRCPSRAPENTNLDGAKMLQFKPPNVEQATKNGIIHAITPRM